MNRLGADGFRSAEDALGRTDQLIGPVPHLFEPLQDLLDPVQQPPGWVPVLIRPVRAGGTARWPGPGRPWRARGTCGTRRAVVSVAVVPGLIVEEFAEQFFGFGGGILRPVGCRFHLVSFALGPFGEAACLPGDVPRLIGTFLGPGDGIVVTPFLGQVGRFLSQVGGFLRPVGGLLGPFSPLAGLLG
jgi:hypothetical protein